MAGNRRLFSVPQTSSRVQGDEDGTDDDDNDDNGILATNRNAMRMGLSDSCPAAREPTPHRRSRAEPSRRLATNGGAHLLSESSSAAGTKFRPSHQRSQNWDRNPIFHRCSEEDEEGSHRDQREQNKGDPLDPDGSDASSLSSDPNGFLYACFKCHRRLGQGRDIFVYRFLYACFKCNRRLGQGRDIYLYRSEEGIPGPSAACRRGSHWLQLGHMSESPF